MPPSSKAASNPRPSNCKTQPTTTKPTKPRQLLRQTIPRTPGLPEPQAIHTPRYRSSPLLLTIIVTGLTITGTLFGASLKQKRDDARKKASAESSDEGDAGGIARPDTTFSQYSSGPHGAAAPIPPSTSSRIDQPAQKETKSAKEAQTIAEASSQARAQRQAQENIVRLQESRTRLMEVKRGLERKIETVRARRVAVPGAAEQSEPNESEAGGRGRGRGNV